MAHVLQIYFFEVITNGVSILKFIWVTFLVFISSISCWAGTLVLFHNHRPADDYYRLVNQIKPGDSLVFSDDKTIVVGPLLGKGNTTLIFSIEDNTKALRIPLSEHTINFMTKFNTGATELLKESVPSVAVYESSKSEYAIVEKLDDFITFKKFVSLVSESQTQTLVRKVFGINKQLPVEEMKNHFAIFAEKIAPYLFIGDMHPENLVYDFKKQEWRLIDWTNSYHGSPIYRGAYIDFDNRSPLLKLLESYGRIEGYHFSANKKKHLWLEQLIEKAHSIIETKRKFVSSIPVCSKIFNFKSRVD